MDDQPQAADSGTICQQRLTCEALRREPLIKIPMEWVFDHAARDLAEYARSLFHERKTSMTSHCFFSNTNKPRRFPHFLNGWCTAGFCFRSTILRRLKGIIFLLNQSTIILKADSTIYCLERRLMSNF